MRISCYSSVREERGLSMCDRGARRSGRCVLTTMPCLTVRQPWVGEGNIPAASHLHRALWGPAAAAAAVAGGTERENCRRHYIVSHPAYSMRLRHTHTYTYTPMPAPAIDF